MAFYASALPYQRQTGELVIELSKTQPSPAAPYELTSTGAVDEGVFAQRMEAMRRVLMRYSWSTVERVYVFVAAALSFTLPWPIMLLADDTYGHIDTSENTTDGFGNIILTDSQVSKLEDARLITFGIIVGLMLFLWGPYLLFKHLGRRRRQALLTSWSQADCSPPRPHAVHLGWRIRSSSTFYGRTQVVVNLPLSAWNKASNFHPEAYLPDYIMEAEKGGFAPPAGPPPDVAARADEKV